MQTDFLDDLLTSHPNEPATKGVVLLLRSEMKSEFKTLRQEFGWLREEVGSLRQQMGSTDQRVSSLEVQFAQFQKSLELVATQVALILQKIS